MRKFFPGAILFVLRYLTLNKQQNARQNAKTISQQKKLLVLIKNMKNDRKKLVAYGTRICDLLHAVTYCNIFVYC